jgi:hypothetical protein
MIVDDKSDTRDRTKPNLVIALSLPFEYAAGLPQMLLQRSTVINHYIAAVGAISKRRVMTSKGTS